jgi:hypothetical protein
MHGFLVIYRKTAVHAERIQWIVSTLEDIKSRWGIQYRLDEIDSIPEDGADILRAQIREIIPQSRGRIVSSGGNVLPLSHGKRLNVENTPILILYEDGRPVQVYPHMLGRAYVSVEEGLNRILKGGPEGSMKDRGLLEAPLQKLLVGNPSMLEDGASCLGVEVDVGVGVADLVLRGGDGRTIIVEVKSHADDSAVGQVSRIAEGYATKEGADAQRVRKAIVCVTLSKNLVEACRGAGIELYKIAPCRVQ